MLARTIMVQGTGSSVGKSVLVTALCRLFRQDGMRVAPFKAQNMALNSAVTAEGLEIGRAQAVQAEAAAIPASVAMNPILLKPEGDRQCQVVVLGKPVGSMSAAEYHAYKPRLRAVIADSLAQLRSEYDLVVIEGAGSPAEINLKDRDIVNMHVARLAHAPVLLVGDIDRGGVFASIVGTIELLDREERAMIAAFVVNKFRGDATLLEPGLAFLRERTGVPVLGVIPYVPSLRVADEDSVSLDDRARRPHRSGADQLDIAVVRLPRISNFDEFQPLEHEPGVSVRFVEDAPELSTVALAILPGSKCTVTDLAWLRERGIARAIQQRARSGEPVLGICGGCQMLGERIEDPFGVESSTASADGLGLLPLITRFGRNKTMARVQARPVTSSFLTGDGTGPRESSGYEIHMGQVEHTRPERAAFEILVRNGRAQSTLDGAVSDSGTVVGTMIHGLLENASVRDALLGYLRSRRGLPAPNRTIPDIDAEYDRLAHIVRSHIDCEALYRIIQRERTSP